MACPQARDSIGKEAECEEFVITIPPELPLVNIPLDLPPAEQPDCCIYRVPKQLRKVNEEAYTPKLVSIGPFHHSRKELRDMEMHKLRYFQDFFQRKTVKKSQEDLRKIIKDNEEKIRHCYSEDPLKIIRDNEDDWRLESNDFVRMILLDAIFIIEFFLKVNSINEARMEEEKDYILSKPWLLNGIFYDLILLENQLPFFVLEELFRSAFNDSSSLSHQQEGQQMKEHQGDLNKEYTPFLKLSRSFFSPYDIDKQQKYIIDGELKHFTDLIRCMLCSEESERRMIQRPRPIKYLDNLYSATKLDYAGLKFKADKKRRLLDITFSRKYFLCLGPMQSSLVVPTLRIYADTEALFRNLMALEQCHYPFKTYICNYVMLMNYLIKTEKDVDLLVAKKVIVNYIGSNAAVAILFDKLCIQIGEVKSCYYDLGEMLKSHYEHPLNHTMATVRNTYFRDFGRSIATVAALLTLLSLCVPFFTDIGSKRN